MHADNSEALAVNARQRAHQTLQRATHLLAELEADNHTVSVVEFARRARVSRSWIYSQPNMMQRLDDLRGLHPVAPSAGLSITAPASNESLLTRLELALQRIHALSVENTELRSQLARALGDLRTDARRSSRISVGDSR